MVTSTAIRPKRPKKKLALAPPTGKALYALPAPMQHECPKCKARVAEDCVSPSGKIVAPHVARSKQLCQERAVNPSLLLDDRLKCANVAGHRGRHRNETGELFWHQKFTIKSAIA